ncbi:MAG: SIR2 family protein [Gallionellaceae bacterium]
MVLDLIRKTARLEGEDCEPDPAEWFRQKYDKEPDYSKLLDEIAKTQTERQQLLRGYFEPNEEERTEGLKLPGVAHKAIARLVAAGYLRVIVTTNFDRLIEKALDDLGVAPTIISTVDQVEGALPLAHSGATVIKLHGDYLDTRIRNTETELAAYDSALDKLLDRVFDEYGLIRLRLVCGMGYSAPRSD